MLHAKIFQLLSMEVVFFFPQRNYISKTTPGCNGCWMFFLAPNYVCADTIFMLVTC